MFGRLGRVPAPFLERRATRAARIFTARRRSDSRSRNFQSQAARRVNGYFQEIVEPENALVSSETAQKAVEELRERGMSFGRSPV